MSNFLDTIRSLRGGLVLKDLERQLEQVINGVQDAGKKGTVTLTLTLEPHGKENKEIHVKAKAVAKAPPAPGLDDASIFFAVRGSLVRDDPEQKPLGLRGVSNDESELRADGSSPAEGRARSFGNA